MGATVPTIWKAIECAEDYLKHAVEIAPNFTIGEPQSRKVQLLMTSVPRVVAAAIMRVAVDFNDQAFRGAEEVHDGKSDYMLSPELEPSEL